MFHLTAFCDERTATEQLTNGPAFEVLSLKRSLNQFETVDSARLPLTQLLRVVIG
jgi:hypothetical protein